MDSQHKKKVFKFLLIMKMVWIIAITSVLQLSAATYETYSQTVKLDLKLDGAKLEEVIWSMKRQTDFNFFYNSDDVKDIMGINISVKNASPEEVLNICLKGTDLTFEIVHKTIIIKKTVKNDQKNIVPINSRQEKEISGVVRSSNGEVIAGATVALKGTSTGTITNVKGEFKLLVPDNATSLVISFIGKKTLEITISDILFYEVVLEEDIVALDEVVAVGYGFTKKINVTGAVSTLNSQTLRTIAPVASTTNALAGRIPGLFAIQSTGAPGADGAALSIRGFGDALVIIDGVEASTFNNISASEIESISVLKDASAAIYGARAGNGVILVTTKRGKSGKPTITLNSSYTQQRVTNYSQPLNGTRYAAWNHEYAVNKGTPDSYPDYEKYVAGNDTFPSTDWYDLTVRDFAPMQQHDLSISGGNDKIKYYGLIGSMDQETFWKNNGGSYQRYNIRSNVDAQITDNLSMQMGFLNINENKKLPIRMSDGSNGAAIWQDLQLSIPTVLAVFPDPTKLPNASVSPGGSILGTSDMSKTGYSDSNTQNTRFNGSLNYNFPFLKGLSAKYNFNYTQIYGSNSSWTLSPSYYSYSVTSQVYTETVGTSPSLSEVRNDSRLLTNQISMNFDRTFAGNHDFRALILYETNDYSDSYITAGRKDYPTDQIPLLNWGSVQSQNNSGSASEMGRASIVSRLNYAYKRKYLFETTFRADASAKFPEDSRWGYFPSFSAGWRLSEENFLKSTDWITNLKLRGGISNMGYDNVSNFAYLSAYKLGANYLFYNGSNPYNMAGIYSTGLPNPELTWEKMTLYNIGADFGMFNSKLYGEMEVFYRTREGMPATRASTVPTTVGVSFPPENLNSQNNRGVEFLIGTKGSSGEFKYDISGNISYARAKWDHFEEPNYTDPDQKRIYQKSGRWVDDVYGLKTNGLFTDSSQIANLSYIQDNQNNSTLNPGDVRYFEYVVDSVIDWRDMQLVGNSIPHWNFGLSLNFSYKNFDVAALFQGAAGNSVNVRTRVTDIMYEKHWTETNNRSDAIFARNGSTAITADGSIFNNYMFRPGDYLRMKSLNIGYSIPANWARAAKILSLRLFLAGTNLFTISEITKYGLDPEAFSRPDNTVLTNSYYPQQKTYTIGLTLIL